MSDEDSFRLGGVGQIVIGVADIARAREFYGRVLGLRELWTSDIASVYDCGDVRLLVEARADHAVVRPGSPIYFRVDDLTRARRELEARGVIFTKSVDLGGQIGDRDLWMAYFLDPDGHQLALMMEIPKGFSPQ